jgi:uncharacterized protein YkwD/LysM repeat protein
MIGSMKREILTLIIILTLAFTHTKETNAESIVNSKLVGAPSPASSPSEVIAAINTYRAANGLKNYQTNSTLVHVAQAQSDYQASIQDVTHTGLGGTVPRDRVYAAGYGDGNIVWVSEIIYGGYNATAQDAVGWWKTSQIHNDTMLSPDYLEIGAGVAVGDDGFVYYTALCAYSVDGVPAQNTPSNEKDPEESGASTEISTGPTPTTAPIIIPVQASQPKEDGSIVHIVRTGQALWNIAAVYGISVEELYTLNGLDQWTPIHPGDEILVRPASTPITTPKPPRATSTQQPTRTATGLTIASTGESTPVSQNNKSESLIDKTKENNTPNPTFQNPNVRWVIILSLGILVIVLIVSMFLQVRSPESVNKAEQIDPPDPFVDSPLSNKDDSV